MRILLIAFLLAGNAAIARAEPDEDDEASHALEEAGELAAELEQASNDLAECKAKNKGKVGNCKDVNIKGFATKLDAFAAKVMSPLTLKEGKNKEVQEELKKMHDGLRAALNGLKKSVDGMAESAMSGLVVPPEKWQELQDEVDKMRKDTSKFLKDLVGIKHKDKGQFSWHWRHSGWPGTSWVQKNIAGGYWRHAKDADELIEVLQKKLKKDKQRYAARALKIREEKHEKDVDKKITAFESPGAAITWLNQYKGKEDL